MKTFFLPGVARVVVQRAVGRLHHHRELERQVVLLAEVLRHVDDDRLRVGHADLVEQAVEDVLAHDPVEQVEVDVGDREPLPEVVLVLDDHPHVPVARRHQEQRHVGAGVLAAHLLERTDEDVGVLEALDVHVVAQGAHADRATVGHVDHERAHAVGGVEGAHQAVGRDVAAEDDGAEVGGRGVGHARSSERSWMVRVVPQGLPQGSHRRRDRPASDRARLHRHQSPVLCGVRVRYSYLYLHRPIGHSRYGPAYLE